MLVWENAKRIAWRRGGAVWYRLWREVEARWFSGREYCLNLPFGYRTFTPWFHTEGPAAADFQEKIRAVLRAGAPPVSVDRLYFLYALANQALSLPGDLAECGVYRGGTAHLLAQVLRDHHRGDGKRLHLFDTFCGMPAFADPRRDYFRPGSFGDTSLARVKKRLRPFRSRCQFYPGVFPASFARVEDSARFSFVHLDADIYPSVRDACAFFWPRLSVGGILLCDDYGFKHLREGARRAVDEFFAPRVVRPISLPTGQAFVVKTP